MKTIQKITILSLGFLASFNLLAQPKQSSFYAGLGIGYANTPWNDIVSGTFNGTTIEATKNPDGGLTWGGHLGYQFNSWLAAEFGGYALPQTTISISPPGPPITISGNIDAYILYFGLKMSHTITSSTQLYSKFGIGYQSIKAGSSLKAGTEGLNSNNCFGPFFAAGLSYLLTNSINISLQFTRAAGQAIHKTDDYSTNPNLYTVELEYRF